jgi:hypothetical protein
MLRLVGLLLLAVALPAIAGETVKTEASGLRFPVPKEWMRVPAPSDMRAAQYKVPRAPGDGDDAELVLFFFGKGKGGGVQDNLDRWYGQFERPDGKPVADATVVTIRKVNGLKVTAVDVSGTYSGMGPKTDRKSGMRMLAAIVEGDAGPWFFKLIGPEATVAQAKSSFDNLLGSLEVHQ